MREAAGGFASADEAVQAMKRGMDYHPVTSAEEVNLKFPEGITVDEKQNLAFRELCVKTGLTRAQAQALADWQIESETAMMKARTESTTEQLKKEWGADYVRRDDLSQRALRALDKRVGGQNELTSALVNSGCMESCSRTHGVRRTWRADVRGALCLVAEALPLRTFLKVPNLHIPDFLIVDR